MLSGDRATFLVRSGASIGSGALGTLSEGNKTRKAQRLQRVSRGRGMAATTGQRSTGANASFWCSLLLNGRSEKRFHHLFELFPRYLETPQPGLEGTRRGLRDHLAQTQDGSALRWPSFLQRHTISHTHLVQSLLQLGIPRSKARKKHQSEHGPLRRPKGKLIVM